MWLNKTNIEDFQTKQQNKIYVDLSSVHVIELFMIMKTGKSSDFTLFWRL